MTGRIELCLSESEYHAHSALSSTQARKLLDSPARYRWDRDHPQVGKQTFDVGTAVHTKVLGVGAGTVEYPDEHVTASGAVSTKAATVAWAEEQRAAGLTPIAPAQAARVNGMAEAVLRHPAARELLERVGYSETSVFATDPDTGVDLRARFDRLALDDPHPVGIDLKTTGKSASVDGFMRTVATHGYEVQQEFYRHALELNDVPRIPFVFIVVETEAPHLVGVRQLDIEWEQMGAAKVRRAIDLYASCTASGLWPGYEPDVQLISPPAWAVHLHEDEYGPLYEEIAI